MVGSRDLDEKNQQEIKALFKRAFCLLENIEQLKSGTGRLSFVKKTIMKRVIFCEHTQVYYPIMQGQISCQKGTAFFGRGSVKRRSRVQKRRRKMYSTSHLSQALRKASYSDIKKQQIQERLQCANAPMRQCANAAWHCLMSL